MAFDEPDDILSQLEENVDFYQITRENDSLIIKIGTFMDKKQIKKYGLKYDFALTINENTDSGL